MVAASSGRVGDPAWDRWLLVWWQALCAGRRVRVPRSLGHPERVGFRRTSLAEPAGQDADYVLSLRDGSRLHVHAFAASRSFVLHRDRTDPARGMGAAAWHWTSESGSARVALAIVVAIVVTRGAVR